MAKRRKATAVALTGEQREQMEPLWFYFGNYGPKITPGNHSFIQRLLEDRYDEHPLHNRRSSKSELPTPEWHRRCRSNSDVRSPKKNLKRFR